jgi:hypothetical protein
MTKMSSRDFLIKGYNVIVLMHGEYTGGTGHRAAAKICMIYEISGRLAAFARKTRRIGLEYISWRIKVQ